MIIIYLVLPLPTGSSDLPETGRANLSFLLGLASDGVYTALAVTSKTVVSYTTIPPLPEKSPAVFFLLHFPQSHLYRTLSGILPYEARTFLTHLSGRDYPYCFTHVVS